MTVGYGQIWPVHVATDKLTATRQLSCLPVCPAILSRNAHRMGALLGKAGIVHDPDRNRAGLGHRRQRIVARAAQQGLIAPRLASATT